MFSRKSWLKSVRRQILAGGCWFFMAMFAATLAAQTRKPALTREQQEQQAALVVEFRKARTEPAKRLEIIGRAAKIGPTAVKSCFEIAGKELNKPLADYRQQFFKAASLAVAKRSTTDNLQEIADLRNKVLTLSKQENLTEQMIVEVDDPALRRLKEIIIFDRADVLKQSAELTKKRQALFPLGEAWAMCAAKFVELQAASENSKEPKASDAAPPPTFEEYLVKEEELASALAVPMDAATRGVLAANAQLAGRLDAEEARCILDLNLTRNLLGLAPLRIDLALAAAARDHSFDMESLNFFSHDSPVAGKASPADRAQRAGTTASGENIAVGTLDGTVANRLWWHSPGHHKNMLGNHSRVGVGARGKYWTEMFGR